MAIGTLVLDVKRAEGRCRTGASAWGDIPKGSELFVKGEAPPPPPPPAPCRPPRSRAPPEFPRAGRWFAPGFRRGAGRGAGRGASSRRPAARRCWHPSLPRPRPARVPRRSPRPRRAPRGWRGPTLELLHRGVQVEPQRPWGGPRRRGAPEGPFVGLWSPPGCSGRLDRPSAALGPGGPRGRVRPWSSSSTEGAGRIAAVGSGDRAKGGLRLDGTPRAGRPRLSGGAPAGRRSAWSGFGPSRGGRSARQSALAAAASRLPISNRRPSGGPRRRRAGAWPARPGARRGRCRSRLRQGTLRSLISIPWIALVALSCGAGRGSAPATRPGS